MVLDFTESPFRRWFRSFLAQPHQPFFILGLFIFLYSMIVLPFILTGYIDIDLSTFHSYTLAHLMPSCFFLGFLFTVLYRFLLVVPFLYKDYMRIFWLMLCGFVLVQSGFFYLPLLIAGQAIVLYAQASALALFIKAYQQSTAQDKSDPFWIISMFFAGLISNILFIISSFTPQLLLFAKSASLYVFCVGVVFAVSQKMIANFYGFYFERTPVVASRFLVATVISCLCLLATRVEPLMFFGNAVGLVATFVLFYKQDILFRKAPPILWILQAGIFWLIFGFAIGVIAGFAVLPPLLQTHIFALGFMGSMIVGFGSRVSLGHSGQKIEADTYTTTIFVLFQVVVVLRLAATVEPSLLIPSAILLSTVLLAWLYRYAPMLLRL